MTKQEKDKQKEEIIAKYGEPLWDMRDPLNESARQLKALKEARTAETKGFNKTSFQAQAVKVLSESVDLTEEDLRKFDKLEREIVKAYFQDQTLSNRALADRFDVPFQKIVALLRDDRVTDLEIAHFKILGRKKAMKMALRKMDEGDAKMVLEIIKELDLLPASKSIDNTPQYQTIEDPKLEKLLRKTGAWYAGDRKTELVIKDEDLQ